ncbi:YjdF family protein [Bacillus tropicus]|uniref:YjdF family protein n=1 Tax=Bacillus tropicus TaxID=2026188 RepID=UPI0035DD0029
MKLTIYFDGQFWIGILEMYENNKLKVCKHIFGSEPKDSEILDFVFHDMIPLLNGTSGVKNSIDKRKNKTINPKRLIRLAAKEIKDQGVSNKSYEVLRIELEQKKKIKKVLRVKKRRITRKKATNENSKTESKTSGKIKGHPLNLADDLLSYVFNLNEAHHIPCHHQTKIRYFFYLF